MKTFTRIFMLFIFASVAFQSCISGYKSVNGNGNLVRKETAISDYNEIVLDLPADVIYHNDSISAPYIQIYTDENILPYINMTVKNHRLIISTEEHINLRATNFKIFTNSKTLETVSISGSGKVRLKGEVNAKAMEVDISGSGSVLADSLYCERINLNISGSGKMNLKGVSNYTDVNISGSGHVNALEFSSLEANAAISGSGHITLLVGKKLDASVSGSGTIKYKGYPEMENKSVSGSGRITQVE